MTGKELSQSLTMADVLQYGARLLVIEGDTAELAQRVIDKLRSNAEVGSSLDDLLDSVLPVGR